MIYRGRTVARPVHFEGLGLHSGEPVRVTLHPSRSEGILFRKGNERIVACPEAVTDTSRCTRLGSISTVEHLMSALAGQEVTDVVVELDASELPALDGSAILYWEGLQEAGFEDLGERQLPRLFSRIFIQEESLKLAISSGSGHWRYDYDTGQRWPGRQSASIEQVLDSYREEIGPARTFGLEEELPALQAGGLAKGLDLDSALVLGKDGYVNPARFDNEPARHKLLDLMGDLYLSGVPVRFLNVVAERSGHRANVKAAQMLAEALRQPAG